LQNGVAGRYPEAAASPPNARATADGVTKCGQDAGYGSDPSISVYPLRVTFVKYP